MIMYVGLFGPSAVVFRVLMFFFLFLGFTGCLCDYVLSDILLIYSAASLFNKLTYWLECTGAVRQQTAGGSSKM